MERNSKLFHGLSGTAYRNYVHRHNALLGDVKMARSYLKRVFSCPSATSVQIKLASEVLVQLSNLYDEVYMYRRQPDGSVTVIKHKDPPEEL